MSKIALPIAELKPALTGLGKIVSKRCTLPVLSHLHIERTKDGWIVLTATDLDHFASVRLEQPEPGEPIALLVPFEELQKVAKNASKSDQILIGTHGNASEVSVEYAVGNQVAENVVATLPPAGFPSIPRIEGEPVLIEETLRSSIHDALECASTDETRLILNSAFIDVSNPDGHYVVGTNGSHLFASNSFKLPLKESLVLPTHKFLGYKEFNADGDWQLRTREPQTKDDHAWISLSSRRWSFITKQLEGAYPQWRQVVPTNGAFNSSISIKDTDALADIIERLPDHDPSYHAIGIQRQGSSVHLRWKSDREQPWKNLPITVEKTEGPDITIYLNRLYLIKALRFGLGRMEFIDGMSPIRFSQGGRQLIAMPVRVDGPSITPPASAPAEATPQPAAEAPAAQPNNTMPEEPAPPATIEDQIESAITEVETMKDLFQQQLNGLKTLTTKLKSIQREHKSSTKELHTVRQTLKGVQGHKL